MKKKFLSIASLALCGAMIFSVGCTNSGGLDSENRPLRLAINSLEGNFNPFFYTAQNDGEIAAMTQLPLMTIDGNGDLAVGQNEACVALDYRATTYDANHIVSPNGDMNGTTEYEIIIKKGIKFSDGEELTIKDVLFNFYVYLDPSYTGSSTIYSTDIVGLNAYRAQDPTMTDETDLDLDKQFNEAAQTRIDALINWSTTQSVTLTDAQRDDLATVVGYFTEEATTDWNTYEVGWEDMYGGDDSKYKFNAAWEAYMFAEGLVTVQTQRNSNGSIVQVTDADGNYLTTLDPNSEGIVEAAQYISDIADATTDAKVTAYMNEHSCTEEVAKLQLQKEYCVQTVIDNYTDRTNIASVLMYWATGGNVLTHFAGEARTSHYDDIRKNNNGQALVPKVEGINTDTTRVDFAGNDLGEDYDVLKITINGVDPKAVWNFCFSIAPLHYYSGTYNGVNYVTSFNGTNNFGVLVGSTDFYNTVLRATEKNGLPVGAGSYMASSSNNGNAATTRTDFYSNYVVYFMRNDNFTTVGTGIENAKIKYIRYTVMSDASIVDALRTGHIDYGEPNATSSNQTEINTIDGLVSSRYQAGSYGYVGINPKYVPEYQVRQAIMKALDASRTVSYYGSALASQIYRPLSRTSWVYDYEGTRLNREYESIAYATEDKEITDLVEQAGYRIGSNGVYQKGNRTLRLTFTIAGESSDHPAYSMFTEAADRLNQIGFDITVQTDLAALSKLNTGSLAVWAAAWTSSIDPDMYQVYHKDSMATSVNNWNYSEIKYNTSGDWGYEYNIVNRLSAKIEDARETLDRATRSTLYADCLDMVMQLAVEFPTYQRSTLAVYNGTVLDGATLIQSPSANLGLLGKVWEADYVK